MNKYEVSAQRREGLIRRRRHSEYCRHMGLILSLAMMVPSSYRAEAVELKWSPPLWPGTEAFPRVVGTEPAARRMNETLRQADIRLGRAVRDCAKSSIHPSDLAAAWKRTVRITMNGPNFLSLVADDMSFCGGAHPDSGVLALVFDLHNGQLVNWKRLLPANLVRSTSLDRAPDGGKISAIGSDELSRNYQTRYPATPPNGISADDWPSCQEAAKEARSFLAWPVTAPNGIALQPIDLPHAAAACELPVTIPTATLSKLGVTSVLTDALGDVRK